MTMLSESEYEVAADGTVTLRGLEPGRRVRVAVYRDTPNGNPQDPVAKYRGRLVKYDRPFDPLESWESDWEPSS